MSKGTAIRILQAVALVAAGVWLLAGCGEVTGGGASEITYSGTLREETITLSDQREVTCITLATSAGGAGLSCDWGSDG